MTVGILYITVGILYHCGRLCTVGIFINVGIFILWAFLYDWVLSHRGLPCVSWSDFILLGHFFLGNPLASMCKLE
jgi:hypothetical protein